ncbi:LysR family transcriptional regulator [Paenibacillus prosopidis]|uniref:DNA-binding transcriptional LysR family regulator n=1 Tax=Paenibacillus prosopidis TaxID=630520 RepID=A0A368VUF0_9BACL|nr:LysR family transcriptional regulator [Paenibacillus prosopidis]RCW45433.1 DNA-binding transcriptional LysR family regulator [Paenibacillus prosopidis]
MELLQLHYFRTVARLEHMTKAAQELHIAQPALSKTIARLEEDLGVPLFDRQGRQIRLNTFGKAFLAKAETALTALEEGRRELADLAGMERGSIHLAAPTLNRLSGLIGDFLTLHPEVQFHLAQASTEEMVQQLENGQIDFCFTALPIGRPGIHELPVLNEEVFLAVPPGHRLASRTSINLSEVADESFIGYKKENIFRKRDDEIFEKAGITPNIVCEINEPSAKASLIKAGLGIAFVGACNRSDEAPPLPFVLLHIDNPRCQSSFQLAWHEKHYLSKAACEFRDFAVQYFAGKRGQNPFDKNLIIK